MLIESWFTAIIFVFNNISFASGDVFFQIVGIISGAANIAQIAICVRLCSIESPESSISLTYYPGY